MGQIRASNNALLIEEQKAGALGYQFIAGIDEAGRGPLAGPVVAAAVILKDYIFPVRIDDSKRLTANGRQRAYRYILEKSFIGIGIVPEDIIDKINIHRANILAMETAVSDLNIEADFLLIDGTIRLRHKCRQLSIIDGDQKSLSIACASIVAKVTRDRLLQFYDKLFPRYGFARHKGYGTREHIAVLRRFGYSPIHRRTFSVKNVRRITNNQDTCLPAGRQ